MSNINAREISQRLAEQAETVARYLLPAGKTISGEWCVADASGKPGKSMKIKLTGSKAGHWCDFADNQYRGKNLVGLWAKVRNITFLEAADQARLFLGLPPFAAYKPSQSKRKWPQTDKTRSTCGKLAENGAVWQWLVEQRRISPETLTAYRIAQSRDGKSAAFPFYHEDKLRMVKFRSVTDKNKTFVSPKDVPKILFGIQAIPPEQIELYITEGELDTLAMHTYSLPAVSLPFGAKGGDANDEWIDNCFEWLQRFEAIYLCLDADEPGQKAVDSLISRLGRHRTVRVVFPPGIKDANDCLMIGMPEREFHKIIADGKPEPPPRLKHAELYSAEISREFYPADGEEPGDPLPWAGVPFRFRDSELTIWTGWSKHGKSTMIQYILGCIAMERGRRACIASMEIKPRRTYKNMIRQLTGKALPDDTELAAAINWLNSRFWVYDYVGTTPVKDMLEAFEYATQRHGVRHCIIDSLMKLKIDEEDHATQKQLVDELSDFAKRQDIHVHLVAHSKKPEQLALEERTWPSKYAVRGSAHIVDLADNVICVWRNRKKERITDPDAKAAEPDGILAVQGQRGGNGEEPVVRLWYDYEQSWRFHNSMAIPRESWI